MVCYSEVREVSSTYLDRARIPTGPQDMHACREGFYRCPMATSERQRLHGADAILLQGFMDLTNTNQVLDIDEHNDKLLETAQKCTSSWAVNRYQRRSRHHACAFCIRTKMAFVRRPRVCSRVPSLWMTRAQRAKEQTWLGQGRWLGTLWPCLVV